MEKKRKPLYSPKEAAAILQMSAETLRRWCRTGRFGLKDPHGRGWWIRRDELERYLPADEREKLGVTRATGENVSRQTAPRGGARSNP